MVCWHLNPFMFSYFVTIAGVDHCAQQDHGCEQLCLNTEESFVCQCSEGFLINDDLKTCSSEFPFHLSIRKGSHQKCVYGQCREQHVLLCPFISPRKTKGKSSGGHMLSMAINKQLLDSHHSHEGLLRQAQGPHLALVLQGQITAC